MYIIKIVYNEQLYDLYNTVSTVKDDEEETWEKDKFNYVKKVVDGELDWHYVVAFSLKYDELSQALEQYYYFINREYTLYINNARISRYTRITLYDMEDISHHLKQHTFKYRKSHLERARLNYEKREVLGED